MRAYFPAMAPAVTELPLVEPMDRLRPMAALRVLEGLPYPFLFHTAAAAGATGGWSFFGADPFCIYRGGDHDEARALWRSLARGFKPGPAAAATGARFTGGVAGYWAYDFGRRLERLPELAHDDLKLPDFLLGFYDVVGAFDHTRERAWVFSSGLPLQGKDGLARAQERLEYFRARFERAGSGSYAALPVREPRRATSTFSRAGYLAAVEQVREHIRRGDLFQANLSQRWRLPLAGATRLAPMLFEALTRRSPAPHSAYFGAGDHAIISSSPERFLELRARQVETRPIKGTRPRSANPTEDARLAAELLASAKDRAENVMIVDVLRNDLGRVCETGSVTTTALCELESFAQVHHLTSTVTGRLRVDADALDLLAACFPGGSITGAPKIRAMEILEALEPVRRHVYTGAIGYLGWDGDADWSIAIRTATATADALMFSAGGGITSESEPAAEYDETLAKAEGLRAGFSGVLGEIALDDTAVGSPR